MDIIEANLVNAIREIVKQELTNAKPKLESDYMTRSDVEYFMEMDAFSYLTDDIDDAIGQYIRNNVTVEINT